LLIEDTERRAVELGAIVIGAAAKSWLGVPLMVGGEVIGAIVLQDLEHEQRFNDNDVRLISNLASQVAVSVRNAHLLAETRQDAERERVLAEITNQLWASTDLETILRTAVSELGSALRARRGKITLELDRTA
jgi:two-component system sensor histidine kinase DevS